VAAAQWPGTPCAVAPHVVWETPESAEAVDGAGPGYHGDAEFRGWYLSSDPGPCTVHVVPNRESTQIELCTVLQHEFGHAIGLPHSPDPASVMAPNPQATAACVAAFPPPPPRLLWRCTPNAMWCGLVIDPVRWRCYRTRLGTGVCGYMTYGEWRRARAGSARPPRQGRGQISP
jgi:hypothetical protein